MIGAIIQARMGSTRLPQKTLRDMNGKPLLLRVIERVKQASTVESIIVATTAGRQDDLIETFCIENGVLCFRGSEDNVLERYYQAALFYGVDIIVRITADDPFKDPDIIDRAVSILNGSGYDYVCNTIKPTFPEGADVEVFTFDALKKARTEAGLLSEREHVTPYIWKHPYLFRLFNFENDMDYSGLRLTVDTEKDFELASIIYKEMDTREKFKLADIIKYLNDHPYLMKLNNGITRNEGYLKSVALENEPEL